MYRNEAIVRIVNTSNDRIWGTGSAVGPNKILTSAHVAQPLQTNSNGRMVVYSGEHDSYRPLAIEVLKVDIHPKYNPSAADSRANDIAVLTVNYNFSEYFEAHPITKADLAPPPVVDRFSWIGYPSDLFTPTNRLFSQWSTESFDIIKTYFVYIPKSDGTIEIISQPVPDNVLRFNEISAQGQSGSPLINIPSVNRGHRVFGVLRGGPVPNITDFTLLVPENFNFVLNALRN
ncbi:trypsin-like serine peptidase [Enterococcus rotai]|uniref:trypsin-like serine peptidase n=1 Tax=Enterococcus rotai TaxID=118060 RepID=UPI0032B4CA36